MLLPSTEDILVTPSPSHASDDVQKEIVRILDTFTELTIVQILDNFTELTTELTTRKKQYNHYRDQLLCFEER